MVTPSFQSLLTPAPTPNSKGNPFSRGVKYVGVGKLAIFDGNRRLSQKRCEIGRGYYGTLIGSHGYPIDWYNFR